ncbi:hypothetical protein [Pedobacter sp. MW01-1-1]|uniref:hypothetical protein n=1 Tax=Pedobacter sp. MW01-1-1 TaxID=3383027 RepID=UPI003FF0C62F
MNIELSYLRQIFDSIAFDHDILELDIEKELNIPDEVFRLKQNIHSHTPDKLLPSKTYINIQISSVSRLILELEDTLEQKTVSANKVPLLKTMLNCLQELIEYLWKYYPNDFDQSTIVSKFGINRYLDENKSLIAQSTKIIDGLEISAELKDIFKKIFLQKLPDVVSYHCLVFSREIMHYLRAKDSSILTQEHLTILLISKQFNHPIFYDFCKAQLNERLMKLSVISDHFRELILIRKNLIQNSPLNLPIYSPLSEPIQDTLLKMIDSELDFLKELDFINTELVNSGLLDSNYKVSLSVKQLAFYISLNVEAGIITEQKATRIHHYITSHVSTLEKQDISEKSFSNAYYVHSPEDIRKVSEKLARMLALAQEKY